MPGTETCLEVSSNHRVDLQQQHVLKWLLFVVFLKYQIPVDTKFQLLVGTCFPQPRGRQQQHSRANQMIWMLTSNGHWALKYFIFRGTKW